MSYVSSELDIRECYSDCPKLCLSLYKNVINEFLLLPIVDKWINCGSFVLFCPVVPFSICKGRSCRGHADSRCPTLVHTWLCIVSHPGPLGVSAGWWNKWCRSKAEGVRILERWDAHHSWDVAKKQCSSQNNTWNLEQVCEIMWQQGPKTKASKFGVSSWIYKYI